MIRTARRTARTGLLLLGLAPAALVAQAPAPAPRTAAPPTEDAGDDDEIIVKGTRLPGAVVGDIEPEVQLSPADIRAYGVSSISDLLEELSPQTGSNRGRGSGAPVVLLNGRRISSFAEIRDIPTEAILRVDILPEEVALKYGFSADQKVVNFVLRPRFRAVTGEAGGGFATEGGGANGTADADILRIQKDHRFNLDAKYTQSARLTEDDRDLISRTSGQLYAFGGNVAGPSGGEIDPALSALAGRTVTAAPIPANALAGARPQLGDFVGGANVPVTSATGASRTLKPASRQFTLNSVYSRNILGTVAATVNGTLTLARTDALLGTPSSLVTVPAGNPFSPFAQAVSLYRYVPGVDPLRQRVDTNTGHFGVTLNGDAARWRWTVTGNYDHGDNKTATDRGLDQTAYQARISANDPTLNPFAALNAGLLGARQIDSARALSDVGEVQAIANGQLATLPAGPISTTLKIGGTETGLRSRATRFGVYQSSSLSRGEANGQVNVDLPITSRKKDFLPFLGELSVNGNAAVDQVQNFGTLRTYGYGVTWTPVTILRIVASVTDDQNAPTVQQLGNPTVLTPGVRVFDYQRGTTVDVVQVSGGNPALLADNRHVMKLGFTMKPTTKHDLTLTADYVHQRTRNSIATLPAATLAIESAFPDRFVRDGDGNLTRIDARAVNFAREDRDTLRLGINLSLPLKASAALQARQRDAFRAEFEKRRAAAQAAGQPVPGAPGANGAPPPPGEGGGPPPDGPPPGGDRAGGGGPPGGGFGGPPGGGGGGFGGPPGGGGGGGGFGGRRGQQQAGGRIQLALYDNWTLKDDILIRPGVPVLDLLDGASIGTGGGVARHALQAQLGYSNNGLGARLEGNYQTGTTVRAGAGSTTGDLRFAPLSTTNLRVFANLQQLPPLIGKDWARGARLTFSVTNLFDQRQKVRDTLGNTPLSYQPVYLDALGRTVRISFRKLFFSIPRGVFRPAGR